MIRFGAREYPEALIDRLGAGAPDALHLLGSAEILDRPLTALFCSERVAADLVLPALELSISVRRRGESLISGFHSMVERECLRLLLNGPRPLVACLARGTRGIRLQRGWRQAVESGRMLVMSGCEPGVRRPSARSAEARNRMVAALAERVFFVGTSPGGRLHRLAREVAARGQPLACFDHPANEELLLLGAEPFSPGD